MLKIPNRSGGHIWPVLKMGQLCIQNSKFLQFSPVCPVPSTVHTCPQTMCNCISGRCIVQTWLLQLAYATNRSLCNQHWQTADISPKYGTGYTRRSYINPVLASLHLLPVRQQIIYKFASITYKALSTKSQLYLQSIIQDYIPSRTVRSATRNLICAHRTKTATGARALVRLPLGSSTIYMTLYDLATVLPQ